MEWGEWHLGKVTNFYGISNAPRLMQKYNYTVLFDDSSRDLMLTADGYGGHEKETPPPCKQMGATFSAHLSSSSTT